MRNLKLLKGGAPPEVLGKSWIVRTWGPPTKSDGQLFCCSLNIDPHLSPGMLGVVDIGSNSFKLSIYDSCAPDPIKKADDMPRLGRGMTPNEMTPRLNDDGVKMSLERTLPAFRNLLDSYKVTTVCVICTEAVRAAYNFHRDPVEKYLEKVANILGIPRGAINIVSEGMEALLAVLAVLHAHRLGNGYGVMMGGNSTEVFEIIGGKNVPGRKTTIRIGINSLEGRKDADQIIASEFNGIDWFPKNLPLHTPDIPEVHGRVVWFLGGTMRVAGREIAQRIHKIDFAADIPFDGYGFAWDGRAREAIDRLCPVTEQDLHNGFLKREWQRTVNMPPDELEKFRSMSRTLFNQWKDSKAFRNWLDTDLIRRRQEKWRKRVGRRSAWVSIGAIAMRECLARARPYKATVSPHSTREGVKDYPSLARPDFI